MASGLSQASLREGGGTSKPIVFKGFDVTEGDLVTVGLIIFYRYALSSTASRSPLPEGAFKLGRLTTTDR